MQLKSLKRLKTLMEIHGMSGRDVAKAAGYKSHTYMTRILRGEYDTMSPEAALRLAAHFKVGVDDLFLVRVSTDSGQTDRSNAA